MNSASSVGNHRNPIKLLIADVDGTLVTNDKVLTDRACRAVENLNRAGIQFAITSGRPPRGMAMLIEPLHLTTPISAFNGGLLVRPDLSIIDQKVLPADIAGRVVAAVLAQKLDAWIYRGNDWYVRRADAPHVAREAWTVKFEPTVVADFSKLLTDVVKVVGVSDNLELMAAAEAAVRSEFEEHVSASRSQPYYLDVTHPESNKGSVVRRLAHDLGISMEQIATIGDMPNDVLMFAVSGMSIAMGNADAQVQRAARRVTASNQQEGFAVAVEKYILKNGPG